MGNPNYFSSVNDRKQIFNRLKLFSLDLHLASCKSNLTTGQCIRSCTNCTDVSSCNWF